MTHRHHHPHMECAIPRPLATPFPQLSFSPAALCLCHPLRSPSQLTHIQSPKPCPSPPNQHPPRHRLSKIKLTSNFCHGRSESAGQDIAQLSPDQPSTRSPPSDRQPISLPGISHTICRPRRISTPARRHVETSLVRKPSLPTPPPLLRPSRLPFHCLSSPPIVPRHRSAETA